MQFEYSEAYGELVARSSRTLEPVLLDVVDNLIPKNNSYRLLEVGCGSGIYIKRACELNPLLTAVGLEVQQSVAEFARENIKAWSFEDRVAIENTDIRKYECKSDFDLVTFYNLIYYFPVDERIDLLKDLGKHLKPGGELILTSMCKGKDPSLSLMNLWTSMTDGYGPLPCPKQIHDQLKKAGYRKIKSEMLIPSFVLFRVIK
jgi:cyclopropane fatty-acyl-phospholipid synthase-like methyltransferase